MRLTSYNDRLASRKKNNVRFSADAVKVENHQNYIRQAKNVRIDRYVRGSCCNCSCVRTRDCHCLIIVRQFRLRKQRTPYSASTQLQSSQLSGLKRFCYIRHIKSLKIWQLLKRWKMRTEFSSIQHFEAERRTVIFRFP